MVQSQDFYSLYQTTYQTYTNLYGEKVCVFLQKGSFYEFYGQQDPATQKHLNTGKQMIDLLGGVATVYQPEGPKDTIKYFWGVPVTVLDKWASKLTKTGWTVVVMDEIKNGAQKVSRREVTKVLSAGTHLESAESGVQHCISALWLQVADPGVSDPPTFGVATADLTTGQVFLYEGKATGKADCWHTDDLRHFFQVHPPKELVLLLRNTPTAPEDEWLRRTLHIPSAPIHVKVGPSVNQGNLERPEVRAEYLQSMFQPRSALPLRTWLRCAADGSSLAERALVSLVRFSEDHATTLAQQLQAPHVWHPTQNLQIINNALTQLNLIGSTSDQPCVEDLFRQPLTAMGKRSLSSRLCSPLADSDQIRKRHGELTWVLKQAPKRLRSELDAALNSIGDLARLHRSLIRGTVQAADVVMLYQSYVSAQILWKALEKSPFTVDSSAIPSSLETCLLALQSQFDIEKARKAIEKPDELGFLLASSGPVSHSIESKIVTLYSSATTWLSNLLTHCGVDGQACYYKPTEKNMFSVHTTRTALKQVEQGIKTTPDDRYKKLVCKSLTTAGRLEHPDLDHFQEELDGIKAQLERAQKVEVPAACIQIVLAARSLWQPLEEWITHVDVSLAMAKTSEAQGWVEPTILDSSDDEPSTVELENLRHPLIESQKRASKYVTHSVSLAHDGTGWLLYGMNASGKSSLMKAIGLSVLLAQVGCYVPATSMRLRPFRRLATRILNQDNLWAGLSSFAVEMSELREILTVADHHTLVLGDELCAGTESISGTSIVAAGIQHLHKAGARFVLATHLHDLMKLKAITSLPCLKVWHLHVEYDPVADMLVYHRTLRPGSGSSMYGLEVAKALHLPRDMIEAAFALRRELLKESAVEDADQSRWNPVLTRKACSVCGTTDKALLEVHHLQERANAQEGRNKDGTALNHVRNLAVLCQTCHDKHHAGLLVVGEVEDTSEGPKRSILDLSDYAFQSQPVADKKTAKTQFSEEQLASIQQTMKQYQGIPPRLMVFQIQRDHQIEITETQLKTLLKKGLV
jgi:DNA mismatch repair protein MutS